MHPTIEYQRVMQNEKKDGYSYLHVTLGNYILPYTYKTEEWKPAMRFVRRGLAGFLQDYAKPIIIPPSEDDEGMNQYNHFTQWFETVFERGYIAMLHGKYTYLSPAILIADTEFRIPDYLDQLNTYFGRAIRIVPPDAIKKLWGGTLNEFDEIVWHDGEKYHRRPMRWSEQNKNVYAAGIPVSRYLDLLESHPPDPRMSYEDYFNDLKRKAKQGIILPSPWTEEVLYPGQPRLF